MELLTSFEDAEYLLSEWGKWSNSGGAGVSEFVAMMPRRGLPPNITDDQAVLVDSIVASLRDSDPSLFNLAVMHYLKNRSMIKVSSSQKVSLNTAYQRRAQLIGYVSGRLSGFAQSDLALVTELAVAVK